MIAAARRSSTEAALEKARAATEMLRLATNTVAAHVGERGGVQCRRLIGANIFNKGMNQE